MKKITALLLALMLALSLFGCQSVDSPLPSDEPDTSITGATETTTEPAETDPTEITEEPTTEEPTEAETTQAPTEPPATQKPTDPPATQKPTEPPATQKPTEPPATQKPTEPPATQKPTDPPATEPPVTNPPATEPPATQAPVSQSQQLVDQAFQLGRGEVLGTHTLTGTVSYVKEVSASYGNATFEMQVEGSDGSKTILCYRVKPTNVSEMDLAHGDTVTVTGSIENYKGTIEFNQGSYTNHSYSEHPAPTTTPATSGGSSGAIDVNGHYDSVEDVALYIHLYGRLPSNYVTKSQYNDMGRPDGYCAGGDRFYNKEGQLPNASGRIFYECDIDTMYTSQRGAKRIVFTNDGLVYYTADHYETFTLLYGTP